MVNEIRMQAVLGVRQRLHHHKANIGKGLFKENIFWAYFDLILYCFYLIFSFIHKVIDGITIVVNTVNVKFHSPAFTSSVQVRCAGNCQLKYI